MKTVDIVNYPIFRVGTWNKMDFTLADLEQIAATFAELKGVHNVPLKLGHDDPLGDAQLALGWIQNVRVSGNELIADFSDVPKIMKDLIKQKRYRSVSVELLMGAEYDGKKPKYLLDAVAVLGATRPAVSALPDLRAFLASRSHGDVGGRRVTFSAQGKRTVFTLNHGPSGGSKMDEETREAIAAAVKAAVAPLQEQINSQHSELTTWKKKFADEETARILSESKLKGLEQKDKDREADAAKAKITMARKGVVELLEGAVKAKKITPAQRDRATKMFGVDDDTRVVNIELDEVREFFSLSKEDKVVVNGDESVTKGGGGGEGDENPNRKFKDVFQEAHYRITQAQQQNAKFSYGDAMTHVFKLDPVLHREYLDTDTPRHMPKSSGGN